MTDCHQQQQNIEVHNKSMTKCSIKHRIENTEEASGSDGSDEDVLHVVTNVYTIPINGNGVVIHTHSPPGTKPIIANCLENGGSELVGSSGGPSSIGIRISNAPTNMTCYQPVPLIDSKRCGEQPKDTCHVFKRVINEPCAVPGSDVTKSKFQIKSIVEIYESDSPPPTCQQQALPQATTQDVGFYKTSTKVNETTMKETITIPICKGTRSLPNAHTHYVSLVFCSELHTNMLLDNVSHPQNALFFFSLWLFLLAR